MLFIASADADHLMTWDATCAAIKAGHLLERAKLGDKFIPTSNGTLMARAASIADLGSAVKSFTVTPRNAATNRPSVQGAMIVFDDETGSPRAIIDSQLITNWKTVADSLIGAQLLANPQPKTLLIVGAGSVATRLVDGYLSTFPSVEEIRIWNRTRTNAEKLVAEMNSPSVPMTVVDDLASACATADIVTCATMTHGPIIKGDWISPGTHIDLIGAFKADMREADDTLLRKSQIFVDCFDTTIDHIGELKIPLASGAIARHEIRSDLYGLVALRDGRENREDITLFKNGGGAHLDLMVADLIIRTYAQDARAIKTKSKGA